MEPVSQFFRCWLFPLVLSPKKLHMKAKSIPCAAELLLLMAWSFELGRGGGEKSGEKFF